MLRFLIHPTSSLYYIHFYTGSRLGPQVISHVSPGARTSPAMLLLRNISFAPCALTSRHFRKTLLSIHSLKLLLTTLASLLAKALLPHCQISHPYTVGICRDHCSQSNEIIEAKAHLLTSGLCCLTEGVTFCWSLSTLTGKAIITCLLYLSPHPLGSEEPRVHFGLPLFHSGKINWELVQGLGKP